MVGWEQRPLNERITQVGYAVGTATHGLRRFIDQIDNDDNDVFGGLIYTLEVLQQELFRIETEVAKLERQPATEGGVE